MNTLIIDNATTSTRTVVVSPEGHVRPVASVTNGVSQQCVCEGDILVYKNGLGSRYLYSKHGKKSKVVASEVEVMPGIMDSIKSFLDDDTLKLPTGMGWNGEDTIQSMALTLGLDIFLTGLAPSSILGGIMGLDTSLTKPKTGEFELSELAWRNDVNLKNVASKEKIETLICEVDASYKQWLSEGGICVPNESKNWRHARNLPDLLSVSCIIGNDGTPLRFNDLVVWRENEDEPEVISVFDLVKTFKMKTNFITLPFLIEEDVTRIMYILHGDNLSDDGNNIVWLYRNR